MNKVEAIKALAREARNFKVTHSAYIRCKRACKILELTEAETAEMLLWLEFTKDMQNDKRFASIFTKTVNQFED